MKRFSIHPRKPGTYLVIIFLTACFLRIIFLGQVPAAFHIDEIMNGYVGRFILENGRDLYGNRWPLLYFNRFGDYPNALPMYLSGLFTYFFGVNELAVRFPIAFMGSLIVFPIYRLGMMFFKRPAAGLAAATVTAIMPWHIVLSRATAEGILGLTVFAWAILWILLFIQTGRRRYFAGSAGFFLLSYFLYPSFRLLCPFVLLPLVGMKKLAKKNRYLLIVLTLGCILFTGYISTTTWGQGRFKQTSLLYDPATASQILTHNTALSYDEGPDRIMIARLFHNKVSGYIKEFIRQYFGYFSVDFLFLKGGLPPRYAVPDQGLFYLGSILALTGLLFSQNKEQKNNYYPIYLLWLLIIAPLPAALTIEDTPNLHRAIFLVLPLVLLIGYGMSNLYLQFRYMAIAPIGLLLIVEFIHFNHQYFIHTASYNSFDRYDGNKQVAEYVLAHRNQYQEIIMPTLYTLPLYLLFYSRDFDSSYAGRFRDSIHINQIGNIKLTEDICPTKALKDEPLSNILIINSGDCDLSTQERIAFSEIEKITRQNSTKAYSILVPKESPL